MSTFSGNSSKVGESFSSANPSPLQQKSTIPLQEKPAIPLSNSEQPRKRKSKATADSVPGFDTEETSALSTSQLQRVVLIEQLKLLRLKRKRLENEMAHQSFQIEFNRICEDSGLGDSLSSNAE